jgi:predicted SprT family Zn-dependent metalloprotease
VVRPNLDQRLLLEGLRREVLQRMESMPFVRENMLTSLVDCPLGLLKKTATQRHGVTRWERQTDSALVVKTVDLHPTLLLPIWRDYAAFVLFHEFLHALGWRAHDAAFRALEAHWPDRHGSLRGPEFTHAMRTAKASWMWRCPTCSKEFPRQRRGAGRYVCRICRCILVDVRLKDAH